MGTVEEPLFNVCNEHWEVFGGKPLWVCGVESSKYLSFGLEKIRQKGSRWPVHASSGNHLVGGVLPAISLDCDVGLVGLPLLDGLVRPDGHTAVVRDLNVDDNALLAVEEAPHGLVDYAVIRGAVAGILLV